MLLSLTGPGHASCKHCAFPMITLPGDLNEARAALGGNKTPVSKRQWLSLMCSQPVLGAVSLPAGTS